jgi:type II secretory pathway component PulF
MGFRLSSDLSSPLLRFTYVCMTSDRVRRRGEIMAETKEDAYSRLRAQKIRPIRALAEGEAEPLSKIFVKKP